MKYFIAILSLTITIFAWCGYGKLNHSEVIERKVEESWISKELKENGIIKVCGELLYIRSANGIDTYFIKNDKDWFALDVNYLSIANSKTKSRLAAIRDYPSFKNNYGSINYVVVYGLLDQHYIGGELSPGEKLRVIYLEVPKELSTTILRD